MSRSYEDSYFSALWFEESGWTLPEEYREPIAQTLELTVDAAAAQLEEIEGAGQRYHDGRTRPSDKEVRTACKQVADNARALSIEMVGLPWPIRKVLIERMGIKGVMLLPEQLKEFATAATWKRPQGRPRGNAKNELHLTLAAIWADRFDRRPTGSYSAYKRRAQGKYREFVRVCLEAIDPELPVPSLTTLNKYIDRIRKEDMDKNTA